MLLPLLYPYIRFSLGTLYPVYKTWKALKRKDETTRRRWMKYWVSFGLFQMAEFFADITLIFIVPFYYEIKLALLLWLVHGTKLVYDSIVNRELTKREKTIDKWLTRINKYRNEVIALLWFELSRCSIRVLAALMTGGVFALGTKSADDEPSESCNEASPNLTNINNNDVNYRRSKRLEELHSNGDTTDHIDMETDDNEHDQHNDTMSSTATIQYAIVD